VSEDPTLARFVPHRAKTAVSDERLVWAIDTRHLPLYWFPRECPRCTFWAGPRTTDGDVARFLGGKSGQRVHVIEEGWLERMANARLYGYRLPPDSFVRDPEVAGYWVSRAAVDPVERLEIDGLIGRHAAAQITLETAPNVWPLWDEIVASTLEFSGIRLRNAQPRVEPSTA